MYKQPSKQKGAFAIELAFVLFGLCAIFMFTADLSNKVLTRSKLERVSYSLVNILKERTKHFDGKYTIQSTEYSEMEKIAAQMLPANDSFTLKISSLTPSSSGVYSYCGYDENASCLIDVKKDDTCGLDDKTQLTALEPKGSSLHYPLYQVTLCMETYSWFSSFMGDEDSNTLISASSAIAGR